MALSLVSDERQVWMQAQAHAVLGGLLAFRGAWDAAAEHVTAAGDAAALGNFEAVFKARIAEVALARARHQPERVAGAQRPLAGNGDVTAIPMFTSLGWWPPLIVATIDCGVPSAAEAQINDLEQAASARGLDLRARIAGLRARVAQATGQPEEADAHFQAATALLRGVHSEGKETLLDVTQSPGGRLTGTARHPASRHALIFSGTVELVASVEQLCSEDHPARPVTSPAGSTAAGDGPVAAAPTQRPGPDHERPGSASKATGR